MKNIFLVALCLPAGLFAQLFTGGIGGGDAVFYTEILSLDGMSARFSGGDGGGDALGNHLNFTYVGSWTTDNPDGLTTGATTINTLFVDSGAASLASATNARRVEIAPGASLEAASLSLTDSVWIQADANGYGQYKGSAQNMRMQQYVANAGWHNMALPVNGNLSQFGSVNTAVHPNARNIYSWDETNGSWVDPVGAGDGSQVANSPGTGYMVYVGTNGVASAASAVEVRGAMLTSATPSVSNAGTSNNANQDGWNLIANPFSCGLDFTQLSLTDVVNSFSIWDPATSTYKDYSGLVGDIASGVIAPMQAFWVKADGNSPSVGSMEMASDGTVGSSPTFYKSQNTIADRLILEVVDLSDPSVHDEIVIGMIPGTHDGLDQEWDAPTRLNAANVPTLMMVHQGEQLSINAIDYGPASLQPKQLSLQLTSNKQGHFYSLHLHDSLLTHDYHVEIEDTKLQRRQLLRDASYIFTHDTSASFANRFVLHLSPLTTHEAPLSFEPEDWGISQDGSALQLLDLQMLDEAAEGWIYNTAAQLVQHFHWEGRSSQSAIDLSALSPGVYVMHIKTSSKEDVVKVLVP